jgi:hypothetical protein
LRDRVISWWSGRFLLFAIVVAAAIVLAFVATFFAFLFRRAAGE